MAGFYTDDEVLAAVLADGGLANRTAYVVDRVRRQAARGMSSNSVAPVRRVLDQLAKDGRLVKSPDKLGNYGYKWSLPTPPVQS